MLKHTILILMTMLMLSMGYASVTSLGNLPQATLDEGKTLYKMPNGEYLIMGGPNWVPMEDIKNKEGAKIQIGVNNTCSAEGTGIAKSTSKSIFVEVPSSDQDIDRMGEANKLEAKPYQETTNEETENRYATNSGLTFNHNKDLLGSLPEIKFTIDYDLDGGATVKANMLFNNALDVTQAILGIDTPWLGNEGQMKFKVPKDTAKLNLHRALEAKSDEEHNYDKIEVSP